MSIFRLGLKYDFTLLFNRLTSDLFIIYIDIENADENGCFKKYKIVGRKKEKYRYLNI